MTDKIRIVVLGANGFIGGAVSWYLAKAGHSVVTVGHKSIDDLGNIECDVVVNCAGMNRGTSEEIRDAHGIFPKAVFDALTPKTPKIIQISSERVYGWDQHPVVKTGVPDVGFGDAKLESERLLDSVVDDGKLSILRPSNVFGPRAKPYYNTVIATWLDLARSGKTLEYDESAKRDFVHIDRLCEVIEKLVEMDSIPDNYRFLDVRSETQIGIDIPAKIIAERLGVESRSRNSAKIHIGGDVGNVVSSSTPTVPATECEGVKKATSALESGLFSIGENELADMINATIDAEEAIGLAKNVHEHDWDDITYSDDRGVLRELFRGVDTKRMYSFSSMPGVVRGNHFHLKQIESFIVVKGRMMLELKASDASHGNRCNFGPEDGEIAIMPTMFHTVWNADPNDELIVVVGSTQEWIADSSPDTYWE